MKKTQGRSQGKSTKDQVQQYTGSQISSAITSPVDITNPVSDVMEDRIVDSRIGSIQITPFSRQKILRGRPTVCTHWLNPPLKEPAIMVIKLAKQLWDIVVNYDRTNEQSFFEAWFDLLILNETEKQNPPTREQLKRNSRKYAHRLAEYVCNYYNEAIMCGAAFMNLIVWSKFNDVGQFKTLASIFRSSVMNSVTAQLPKQLWPIGLRAYLSKYTTLAYGERPAGGAVVSFPIWAADIFGNRGDQVNDFRHLIDVLSTTILNDAEYKSSPLAELDKRIGQIIGNFGSYSGKTDSTEAYKAAPLRVENALAQSIIDSSQKGATVKPNHLVPEGMQLGKNNPIKPNGDLFAATLAAQYMFWYDRMRTIWAPFNDPMSQIFTFFTEQVKLFELWPVNAVPQTMKAFQDNTVAWDMADMIKNMVYRGSHTPNTSTIVKIAPVNTDAGNAFDDSVFSDNFERYWADSGLLFDQLYAGQKYPHLTPTPFSIDCSDQITSDPQSVGGYRLFMANAAYSMPTNGGMDPSTGSLVMGSNPQSPAAPVGPVLSMVDIALGASLHGRDVDVEFQGLDSESVKDFGDFTKSTVKVVSFKEWPFHVFVEQLPLFDASDPYQCGFNLLLSNEDENLSELVATILDTSSYVKYDQADVKKSPQVTVGANTGNISYVIPPESGSDMTKTSVAHWINPEYRDAVKHSLVFIGDLAAQLPPMALARPHCGNPTETFDTLKGGIDIFTKLEEAFETFDSTGITDGYTGIIGSMISAYRNVPSNGDAPAADKGNNTALYFSALLTLLGGTTGAVLNGTIVTQLFAGDYLPVAPFIQSLPMSMFTPMTLAPANIPAAANDALSDDALIYQDIRPKYGAVNLGMDNTGKTLPLVALYRNTYIVSDRSHYFWLWFLLRAHIKLTMLDPTTTAFDESDRFTSPLFTHISLWALGMYIRSSLSKNNKLISQYYWDFVSETIKEVRITTVNGMPLQAVAAEPRVPVSIDRAASPDNGVKRPSMIRSAANENSRSFNTTGKANPGVRQYDNRNNGHRRDGTTSDNMVQESASGSSEGKIGDVSSKSIDKSSVLKKPSTQELTPADTMSSNG